MTRLRNASGQLAVISILIIFALILGITVTVFVNQRSVWFGVMNQQRQKSDAVVQQGLFYAVHALSDSTDTWAKALQAQFPPEFDPRTPGGLKFFDSGTNHYFFTIACSTGGLLSTYETGVLVTAYVQNQAGNQAPLRALTAAVSQKTLSAGLPGEFSASSAVELFQAPNVSTFAVHWGPVLVHDTANIWYMTGTEMNKRKYPRKFSGNGVTDGNGSGALRSEGTNPQSTDNREYWAYATLGYPPDIDKDAYKALAQATPLATLPTCLLSGGPCDVNCPVPGVNPCGDIEPSVVGDTAVFTGAGPGYSLNRRGAVIYVNGNVQLENVAMDLVISSGVYPSPGALLAIGNVILGPATPDAGQVMSNANHNPLRLPPTYAKEYPYYDGTTNSLPPNPPPCWGMTGSCSSDANWGNNPNSLPANGHVHFRGFLYSQGVVITTTTANIFVVDGAVRADSTFVSLPSPSQSSPLSVLYDDIVNHSVLVSHIELQVDSQQPTPVR